MNTGNVRPFLESLMQTAIRAADPEESIRNNLPARPSGRTVVIGAGKGSAQMARALEKHWSGPLSGVVVTRYGFGCRTNRIEIMEAAHPVPDAAGIEASRRLKAAIRDLGPDDLVIALISGGGSALLPDPPGKMNLDDEIAVNRALLESGAPISVMNTIRKHLSGIKGGRLASLTKAKVVTFVASDIPGDQAAFVASGPTIADSSTRQDALKYVAQYGMTLPDRALEHLNSPAADAPLPDDPAFARNEIHLVASARRSLLAAAEQAKEAGVAAVILSDSIEGEAKDVAAMHAAISREVVQNNQPFQRPVVVLSGGETTVSLPPSHTGRGGRNTEFALSFALNIQGLDVQCIAVDTDGIDGSENNAGAYVDGGSVTRMLSVGVDPKQVLASKDSWSAFHAVGDLVVTGPTGVNVNDFRCILIC
ncbi:glycerate kinase [Ochrobactrum daejeonense]|nr:glycerate kinase [Brucella daejeonensis]